MADDDKENYRWATLVQYLSTLKLRQEAVIAAIDKLTSAVDTNNELLARLVNALHTPAANNKEG